ncbi:MULTISPECIES: hypothetical protein [unclassified Rathayibacter]|uniref:hypothetical protein n=1 Tax=unclassified Rathayibacter TaxID=2609250 RepID=UPI000CE7B5A1|nr:MULTISPECIES: hypothetical protein [unclassified Rathayibacter]PPH17716.1 hypothetical protein C5C35_06450 [Rathayibacter sp. AY1F8]PPH77478.1 hypothetical protein C5C90_02235 [Rathayibacter sp. AY1D4]PPH91891.1 hypothetical protein C5C64_05715 [Rathayibacter sp. AY1D3]
MSGSRQEEGTLLELVRAADRSPGALWSIRERLTRPNRLSGSYLGLGFLTMAVLLDIRGVISYLWSLDARSATWLSGLSWLLVVAASAVGVSIALRRHGELPRRAFAGVLAVDVAALLLEFADHALPTPAPMYYPSVCVGVGAGVIALITFQPLSRSFLALVVLVALAALGLVGQALLGDGGAALAVSNVLLAVAPAAVCVVVLTSLDQYVRRTLDRSLADGTVHAADDEFSQVDARIEELLERVRTPVPLDEELGERARVLGDELREALARSHDRTWLRIAVEESALLSSAVAIDDPSGAAALLAPLDRSRLLSVLWLLTAPAGRTPLAVRLEPGQGGGVELALVAAGIRTRDLDRSVWGILSELGEHRTTTDHGATRILVAHRPRRRTTT